MSEHELTTDFDYRSFVDDLRLRSTEWLHARRAEVVRSQRHLHIEELAITAVLDDRGELSDRVCAHDGVSARAARDALETARALESLPAVAAAAHAGVLSTEQLTPLAQLADPDSDAEWARRGPNCAPADLARLARTKDAATAADVAARREARGLELRWRRASGMLAFSGQLPDLDGAYFESVINQTIDRMRPPRGQAWDTRAHRGADALLELCRRADTGAEPAKPTLAPAVHLSVQVPLSGSATIAGIPLPDSMLEKLRARARVEPVLVDGEGATVAIGRTRSALSPKVVRHILERDQHCRIDDCTRRHGLQIHHLWPVSWGGSDDPTNLAAVCVGGLDAHHLELVPHGPWLLTGDPTQPDGLQIVHIDDWCQDHPDTRPRAGPHAA